MHALRLLWLFARLGAMAELAYRANFWLQLLESTLAIASTLGVVAIVTSQTDSLHGWRPAELVAVVGVYFVINGLINLVIAPSLSRFMEDVREGTLDFTLTKPEDAQLLVSVSQVHVFKLIDVVMGCCVIALATMRLGTDFGVVRAVMFALALLLGATLVYSFWIALATLAFWFVRLDNLLMIFWMVYGAGRWPLGIYPDWMRWGLTLLVPVAFAVTVPAEALTGRLDVTTLAGAGVLAALSLIASRAFWRRGLRQYAGASA